MKTTRKTSSSAKMKEVAKKVTTENKDHSNNCNCGGCGGACGGNCQCK